MNTRQYNRIEYLEEKYKETTIAKGELLSTETRKKINRKNYECYRRDRVYQILNPAKLNKHVVKDVLYYLEKIGNIKNLCRTCTDAQIISAIAIHLNREFIKTREDETFLWKEHNLNWKIYARIISNLYHLL